MPSTTRWSWYQDSEQSCSYCDQPPLPGYKLFSCSNCQSAVYHNATCQQQHWRQCHRQKCKSLSEAKAHLDYLIHHQQDTFFVSWVQTVLATVQARELSEAWAIHVRQWYQQDYLQAMQGFQAVLDGWMETQDDLLNGRNGKHNLQADDFANSMAELSASQQQQATIWARRFLFCSYCELDAQQVLQARRRLVTTIWILSNLSPTQDHHNQQQVLQQRETLEDAWMELVLSYDEAEQFACARQAAYMAMTQNCCGWVHPYQRPGYMASNLISQPYFPPVQHPSWCQALEDHWQDILQDYLQIQAWSQVGSGDRGSGDTDHRVVDCGHWTEYVLFGTGECHNDGKARITKQLLRSFCPDALTLAKQGGGEVIFSKLAPRTHIQPHCGPTNVRLTAHLGLVVPTIKDDDTHEMCRIRVAHSWHTWQAGKILVFDDSFEHEVRNDTDQERVVLLLRFWHTQLSDPLQREDSLMEARSRKEQTIDKRYHPPP